MNHSIDFDKIETINIDLVIGFGETCRVADALKRNNLRYFSNPFDWMLNYKLDTVIELLTSIIMKTKLNFFVNCIEDSTYSEGNYTGIIDSDNGMISMHDFPKYESLENAPKFFYLKYIGRFYNLNNMLKNANSICFLTNRKISLEDMKNFVNSIKQLYDFKQIYYLNIYDTEGKEEESFEKIEEGNITYFIYRFNDENINGRNKETNPDFWHGNIDYWDKILDKITLYEDFKNTYLINIG